jgi:Poly (ADP-ribose) glycohydrolase (PARG)
MDEIINQMASNDSWSWEFVPNQPKYTLTRGQVARVLAHSYLKPNGFLDWTRLCKFQQNPLAKQRLACLFDYFARVTKVWNMDELIEYERIKRTSLNETNRGVEKECFGKGLEVIIHTNRMEEDIEMDASIVDFANSRLHIHSIIASVTQEELLFSICSECFLGLLLFPTEMEDNECIVFRNVWRHADYIGYGEHFKFIGPAEPSSVTANIIAIDALAGGQYSEFERDIRKAYVGFSAVSSSLISTGNWGCGAFGGNPTLKFIQQIMAAQWAGKETLRYSTFGNTKQKTGFEHLLSQIRKSKITWEWMFETLSKYTQTTMDFENYIKGEILYEELNK